MARYLQTGEWIATPSVPIQLDEALVWISPAVINLGETAVPHGHFILRVNKVIDYPTLEIWQGERLLLRKQCGRLTPNLPVYLSDRWLEQINGSNQPIRVELH